MERRILTFTANEQILIKTSGIEYYASNIVEYIEAHFELGDNWSGYDSVRAVWYNDYATISTVLDSNGVCRVPYEVLTRTGIVKVNLVGSIADGDTLTDRLTTYPIHAVRVDKAARVTGDNASPVTPSEYEQFVAAVRADADRAEAGATSAETSAESASASAQSASTSASDAQTYAQNAEISATSAESAKDDAEDAKEDAESARDEIRSMRAEATTLSAGSDATASYSNGLLSLGIPRGDKGEKGDKGDTGATPNLSIGTVETLPPTGQSQVTITGTAENPVLNFKLVKGDTGEVTMAQLAQLLPTDTASGSIASFPDGTDLFPALSVKAQIEPIQDLHGYDKPWSAGAGKNKLPMTVEGIKAVNTYHPWSGNSTTINNVAITIETSNSGDVTGIRFNGTASADIAFNIATNINIPNGSYKWSNDQIVNVPNLWLSLTNPDVAITLSTGKEKNITINNGTIGSAYIYASAGNIFNNVLFKPMIRLATETDATFAPYSNICPISGHTECVTSVSGVNVWDEETTTGFFAPNGGWNTSSDYLSSKNPISVVPNTTYYCYCGTNGAYVYVTFWRNMVPSGVSNYDDIISRMDVTNKSFVIPTDCKAIHFNTARYGTTYNNDISINYPSTDHEYHAYNGTTHTTDLGRTVYGGTLDVVSGELTDSMGYIASYNGETIGEPWISDRDEYVAGTIPSIGAEVVYTLSTPQTYQLTPQEVELLLGTNNLWTDCGEVNVTYKADTYLWVAKQLGQ